LWWKAKQENEASPAPEPVAKKEEPKPKQVQPAGSNLSAEAQKELKSLRKKLEDIESNILEAEIKVEGAEKELSSPEVFEDPEALAASNEKYQLAKSVLEKLNDEWEEVGIRIEELEKQLA
jgi:ATP-binding cassette, subfamily F, member 3